MASYAMSEEQLESKRDDADNECAVAPQDAPAIEAIEGSVALTVEDFSEVYFKLPSTKRLVFSLSYLVFGVIVPWVGILSDSKSQICSVVVFLLKWRHWGPDRAPNRDPAGINDGSRHQIALERVIRPRARLQRYPICHNAQQNWT